MYDSEGAGTFSIHYRYLLLMMCTKFVKFSSVASYYLVFKTVKSKVQIYYKKWKYAIFIANLIYFAIHK